MSVIEIVDHYLKEKEIIVCTLSWISKLFGSNNDAHSKEKNILLQAIFEIKTPFLMDGEAKKLSVILSADKNEDSSFNENNKRIFNSYFEQKAKKTKNVSILSSLERENINFIKGRYEKARRTLAFIKHFGFPPSGEDFELNNRISRKAANLFLTASDVPLLKMVGKNDETCSVVREYQGHKYLIPSLCRFIVGDVFELQSFFQEELFDVIVIDPPWHNKHVRRKRHSRGLSHGYSTLSVEEIMKIPLSSVLSADAFVFIWVTNNSEMKDEIVDSLHLWDLELLATWFWVKVTQAGDTVVNFDTSPARGKLPYEKLLVTRRKATHKGCRHPFPDHLQNFVFFGIPSSLHSHKPPLKELLGRLLNVGEEKKCLELFARYLIPGWTSLGNESLRLQDLILLQEFNEKSD